MSGSGLIMGALNVALYCVIVIFVALVIVWAWQKFVGPIDAQVYKFGGIIVVLLCLIAVVGWLLGLFDAEAIYSGPHFLGLRR